MMSPTDCGARREQSDGRCSTMILAIRSQIGRSSCGSRVLSNPVCSTTTTRASVQTRARVKRKFMNCAQGPTDAHDRRSPRVSPTEEALNPTDQRVLTAFLAWPDSPVWVLRCWLGFLSTSHVHTPPSPGPSAAVKLQTAPRRLR